MGMYSAALPCMRTMRSMSALPPWPSGTRLRQRYTVTLMASAVRIRARIAAYSPVMGSGMAETPRQGSPTVAQRRLRGRPGWVRGAFLVGLLAAGHAIAAPPVQGTASIDARLDLLFGSHEPYRKFLADL